jgi:hypothetical protein
MSVHSTDYETSCPNLTGLITKYGRGALGKTFFAAAREGNPDATMIVNDYVTDSRYVDFLNELTENGKPVFDVIGIQSHMHYGIWDNQKIWEVCEQLARFNKPIHFTETTILSTVWSGIPNNTPDPVREQTQKEAVERFYTLLFSHPAVEAISWWDLSDKDSWNNAPSGLLRINMTPKPAYTALKKLIKEDWATNETLHTDASGIATLRAFRGKYHFMVSLPDGGKRYAFADVVEKGDNEIVLKLDDLVMKIWRGSTVVNERPVALVDSITFAPPVRATSSETARRRTHLFKVR